MAHRILYLLAFLVAIVDCRKLPGANLPHQIHNIETQCTNRGYPSGACVNYALADNDLECESLPCALPKGNGYYKVQFTGKVADGTPCSLNRSKVCIAGECTAVHWSRMPILIGRGARIFCDSH